VNENRNEEEQLRSVTLQNAQSIFRARQRAEEELVRTKEALWQQSEWLRVTLASIGDAVVTTDTEGRVLTLNGVAEGLTGWTQEEARGRPLSEVFRIVNEETRQPVEDPSGKALREGRIVGLANHTLLLARDGTETPIDDSASPIRDDQGRIHGVVLIFRSIAERKRAEEAQARLAAIVESSQDAIISKTLEGRIVSWNAAAAQLFGYRADEAIGQPITLLIPPELHDEERMILERLRRGERIEHYETVRVTKDGRRREISLTISPVRDSTGRIIGASKVSRDITEPKQARIASALLGAIVDSSEDAIISKDLNGIITSWNQSAERLFGYTAGETIGRSITLLIPPERLDEEPRILERLRRGERMDHFETVRVRKDGTRLDISLTISPVRDAHGRIVGASKIARDITDRKRAEQRLATQNSVTHSLAESASLHEVAPKILRAICEHLHWQVGALWYVDEQEKVLRCAEMYHPPGVQVPRFEAISRARTFERGVGLPGRVWASGTAVCVPDVRKDSSFTRAAVADAEKLHGALGFPIMLSGAIVGVMEFFSHDIRQPSAELLQMMTAIGSQIGQFIERRRAEEALRERENQLRVITDTTPALISYIDVEGRYRFVNRQYELWFGHTHQEIVGRTMAEVLGPATMDVLRPHVDAVLRGERVHFEAEAPYRDGGTRWIDAQYVPDRLADGSVRGFFVFVLDISERKLAEAALRKSEERFRQLADAMPQIVWAARPDGYLDYYNERWYEFTGFPRGEYGQASWEPILHPDDVQRCVDTYFGCIQAGRPYQIEYRFKDRRTGGYRWFLGRADPVRDEQGRITRWFGTCTDIDDTKHAEETTRFLADASAALAELADQESTLQKIAALAVPHFADWCAVDVQEADGSVRRMAVAHVDPAKVPLVRELDPRYPSRDPDISGVRQVIRTGKPEWAVSVPDEGLAALCSGVEPLRILRELGLKSYISVPLKLRAQVLGALTFVTAASGRTYDADDVRAAEDLAHRAVIALENTRLLARLREADRRKDEFLAMLAHELRNPLAPIRNAVHIFRGKGLPVPELQWATEVIDRQVHQMTRLVDDLLDVSRITRGKIELRKQRVDLATIVNSAVEASRPLIEKWSHELTVTVPPQPIYLEADPARLAQVLSNLLNNAAKYTDQGGRIGLTVERQGGQVLIRVRDNGIGISAEMQSRVFDLFTQVDLSVERSEGGLGIGLTLAQRLVEMHGGSVEARSDGPGKGSEFIVRLPMAGDLQRKGPQGTAGGEELAAPPAQRILVVDDNRDAADSLGMLLRMMGNEVHTAHDGLEAVGAVATFQPDVVLLDLGLPKLNGYEVARRIREQEGGADILLVALTGWGQEEDRRRSREAGFDRHMTKPVEFDTLRKLLAKHRPAGRGT
jgi:PAS domain S-box-containing protein